MKIESLLKFLITGLIILIIGLLIYGISSLIQGPNYNYNYIGKIIDMEGGSSSQLIILDVDTIGKTLYTTRRKCSNKIRIGQGVYEKRGSNYLYVKYKEGKYC